MSCSSLQVASLSLLLASAASAPAAAQKSARRTTAEALQQKGLEMVKFGDFDTDGDGKKELIVVARDKSGLRLVVVGEDAGGAVVSQTLPPARGKELATFEGKQLLLPKTSQQVVLETYDETPDEKVKRVRIYAAKDGVLKEIFTSVLNRSKKVDDRPAWERDESIIQYGDARGGWYYLDVEDDGITEIFVRKRPQILSIASSGDPVKLLTGVREQVWRWDDSNFAFLERGEQLNDFLPSQEITGVTASSAWIEPSVLKEMKANALSDALMKGGDKAPKEGQEGAVGGEFEFGLEDLGVPPPSSKKDSKKDKKDAPNGKGRKSVKKVEKVEKEPEPEVEVDRSPFMRHATDKDFSTAWIEDASGPGKGEWIEFELEEEAPIKMVRIVAGCVDTKKSFTSHNVPESFQVRLDNGADVTVDRREKTSFDKPVVAFSDSLVKLKDRPWAKTTLVFFDGKREAKKVRLTLDKAIKQGKGDLTCISEVSIH